MTNSEFIKKVADLVAKYAPNYGVCVYSPIIAQACLESAYGTSELATKANNYFGLKYNASVSDKTAYIKVGSEQNPDGSYVSSVMKWCNFNSFESGVEGYFKFLFKRTGITRYDNLKGVKDSDTYIELIKADGYATSLSYVTSLKSLVKQWNLTQYDPKEVNTMSESSLVSYTKWTNNYTKVTNKKNNYIIPHVYVGQVTTVNGVNHFSTNCNASCTYVIGTDGTIGQCVSENNRSWCTGGGLTVNGYTGSKIDYESITFEMACDAFAPYALNAKVRASMVKLMADCAKRNGMGELKWRADKTLVGRPDLQNVLAHRWFAQKSCPGDWTYNQMGAIVDEANAINGYKTNWKQYDKGSVSPAAPTIVVTPTTATDTVRGVQTFLNTNYKAGLDVDGAFGPASKKALAKAFQTELNKLGAGIAVDGDFGPASQKAFEQKVGILKNGSKGIFVTLWQCLLRGFGQNPNGIDGIFGSGTTSATNALFKGKGLPQDSSVSGSDVNKMI